MRRFRWWGLLLLLIPFGVQAQSCNNLPCGPVPWPVPNLPHLVSPTPMPTIEITAVSTINPTASVAPTDTPMPTGTLNADFTGLGDQLATLQAQINATEIPILVSGTPVSSGDQLDVMVSNAGDLFGYIRGFSEVSLGGLTPFITFTLTSFLVVIAVKSFGFILPIIAAVYGMILKVIQLAVQIIRG